MAYTKPSRRQLLRGGLCGGAALLGLEQLGWLGRLARVSAQEAALAPSKVRFGAEIEPLVRLIEDTPRARLLEVIGQRIRAGLPYHQVLAALNLAGVRNIRPGPTVGGKLHGVLVINSAHLASQASPAADRWLPIFWALDHFKTCQERDVSEGDWSMATLDDSRLPPLNRAPAAFAEAMAAWDPDAADRAVAAWVRGGDPRPIWEALWLYGARHYKDIGHKSIYVANAYRTLQVIGEEFAEPVLRALVRSLLEYRGNDPQADLRPHLPWRHTQAAVVALRPGWQQGKLDPGATTELLAGCRQSGSEELAKSVVAMLNRGVAPQSIWDALLFYSAELVMQRPRIFSLHAQTTTNAMYFAYRQATTPGARARLLVQNAAYMALFREDNDSSRSGWRSYLEDDQALRRQPLDQLRPTTKLPDDPQALLREVFATLGQDRRRATELLCAGLQGGSLDATAVIDAARALIYLKGDDAHDYKFAAAVLEDQPRMSPPWRARYLAANLTLLRGSNDPDNPLGKRTREALAS